MNEDDIVIGADGLARPTWASTNPILREYYDTEWGMPIYDERGLYERLSLEAFQSGLSWSTILHKRVAFRSAFANFIPEKVASFNDSDVQRLLNDKSIVRNRAKIMATINNAQAVISLRHKDGLSKLIWSFKPTESLSPRKTADIPTKTPESIALAKALKKEGFNFVGPTTMFALMEAIGMVDTHLIGSHRRGTSGIWI